MSDLLPLFPLPNVVLFPNVFLPLHVFEPRYREMVADALAGDRMLGLVLLRPGWEHDYERQPAIYSVGCNGLMSHSEKLPDGRYNIIIRGIERFRIRGEDYSRSYRRALVEPLPETAPAVEDRHALAAARTKLTGLLSPFLDRTGDSMSASALDDTDMVNALAQYLQLEPLEKQALLECASTRLRAEALIELLEMKILMARTPGGSTFSH